MNPDHHETVHKQTGKATHDRQKFPCSGGQVLESQRGRIRYRGAVLPLPQDRSSQTGQSRTTTRTVGSEAQATDTLREVVAGSTLGCRPNTALQRIAARWRFCISRTAASGPLALRAGVSSGGSLPLVQVIMLKIKRHGMRSKLAS
jgi:hypothetical protein